MSEPGAPERIPENPLEHGGRYGLGMLAGTAVLGLLAWVLWPGSPDGGQLSGAHILALICVLAATILLIFAALFFTIAVIRTTWQAGRFDPVRFLRGEDDRRP
jgi:hypothetical protein